MENVDVPEGNNVLEAGKNVGLASEEIQKDVQNESHVVDDSGKGITV